MCVCVCITNKIVELAVPQKALCEEDSGFVDEGGSGILYLPTLLKVMFDVFTGGKQIRGVFWGEIEVSRTTTVTLVINCKSNFDASLRLR